PGPSEQTPGWQGSREPVLKLPGQAERRRRRWNVVPRWVRAWKVSLLKEHAPKRTAARGLGPAGAPARLTDGWGPASDSTPGPVSPVWGRQHAIERRGPDGADGS